MKRLLGDSRASSRLYHTTTLYLPPECSNFIFFVEMRFWSWSTILGISVLTGGIQSAEINRAADNSEAGGDRDGKCKDNLTKMTRIVSVSFLFSFQCFPNSKVQERGVHHRHRVDGHLLHGVRVFGRRGHRVRLLRIFFRNLLPL